MLLKCMFTLAQNNLSVYLPMQNVILKSPPHSVGSDCTIPYHMVVSTICTAMMMS